MPLSSVWSMWICRSVVALFNYLAADRRYRLAFHLLMHSYQLPSRSPLQLFVVTTINAIGIIVWPSHFVLASYPNTKSGSKGLILDCFTRRQNIDFCF